MLFALHVTMEVILTSGSCDAGDLAVSLDEVLIVLRYTFLILLHIII